MLLDADVFTELVLEPVPVKVRESWQQHLTTHASETAQESTTATENAPRYRCLHRASVRATATTLNNTAWTSESNRVAMATTINTCKAVANPSNLSTDKIFSQLPHCIECFGANTTNHQCNGCDCTIHWICTLETKKRQSRGMGAHY